MAPTTKSRRFYQLRVALLLVVLGGVVLWAANDWWRRHERTAWKRPLRVALVLVEREPVPAETARALTSRAFDLEQRLNREFLRHTGAPREAFSIVVKGPTTTLEDAPRVAEQNLWGLLRHSYALWQWTRAIDRRASVEWRGYDARIYLLLRPGDRDRPALIEGESEDGGRIGIAQAELRDDTVDFALFVAAHELFHTLGATDKYDAFGRSLVPDGLAEPELLPLYPQRGAEIMARNLALSPTSERPPESLAELVVGLATAREIGWRG